MVMSRLQLRIAKHVIGVPFTDFGSLVMAFFNVENSLARRLWPNSFSIGFKGKRPWEEQMPDASTISPTRQRTFRRHQSTSHVVKGYSPYPDISIDSWFHLDLLIGHTHILLSHRLIMLLSSQEYLIPLFLELDLHRLALLLLWGYHDASLS